MNIVRPEAAARFLEKFPFAFALQPFHNETTEGFCDIILPEAHYLEVLDISSSFGVLYNYPIGLDKWSFHVGIPVTEPKFERRSTFDIFFDLADRVGIRDTYNGYLENIFSTKLMNCSTSMMVSRPR